MKKQHKLLPRLRRLRHFCRGVHLFAFVHPLMSHDGVRYLYKGFGAGTSSGRWFLELLERFAEWLGLSYNLPMLNGLIYLLLLSLAAGLCVGALSVRGKLPAILIGILFVVFPSVTATMYYRFTTVAYGISVLLAVMAAWVLHRYRLGVALSGLCIALSMGIYQGFVPLTICIMLLKIMREILCENFHWLPSRQLVVKVLHSGVALLLGALLYMKCVDIALIVWNTELSNYQNIANMGNINVYQLPQLVRNGYALFFSLTYSNVCGLSFSSFLQLLYSLTIILSLVILLAILVLEKIRLAPALICLGILGLYPIGVNFISLMSPGFLHTLMLYGFVMVPCLPIILSEYLTVQGGAIGRGIKQSASVLLTVFLIFYGYAANMNHTAVYYSNLQTANYLNAMVAQIRMTDGYNHTQKWAFIGELQDPQYQFPWKIPAAVEGNNDPIMMLNYVRQDLLSNYLGYQITIPTEEELELLSQTDAVRAMPCWPDQGSIQIIDDIVVIKCENPPEDTQQ